MFKEIIGQKMKTLDKFVSNNASKLSIQESDPSKHYIIEPKRLTPSNGFYRGFLEFWNT